MEYVWAIVLTLVVLGVSLYNYFDSKDLNQLTSTVHNNMVFSQRNRRYGAYTMRKSYNQVMLFILGGTVVLFAATMGTHYTLARGGNVPNIAKAPEILDTALLNLNTPPEEQEKTLPPTYSIKSSSGSGGESASDQEAQEEQEAEKPNDVREPERSENTGGQPKEKPATEKTNQKMITDVNDPEYYRDAGSKAVADANARAAARKQREEERKRQEELRKQGNNQNGSNGREGSIPKNQPMVDFALAGRTPYDNDIWYVRNPGYTCGKGVGGTVIVNIKVNSNGNVTEAVPHGNVSSLDPCLVEKAVEYAKKSRFNASSKPSQEGSITYKFKPQ
jgi:TonB family protein